MANLPREDLPYGVWFVKAYLDSDTIEVYPMYNDYMKDRKARGWTWRSKWKFPKPKNLEKAIFKCQKWCDDKMAREAEAREAMDRLGLQ